MIIDSVKVIGCVDISLYDEYMEIKNSIHINNLVVQTGKNLIASRLAGNSTQPISHIGVGISNITTTLSAISLNGQVGDRVAIDTLGGIVVDNELTYSTTFVAGACTGELCEIGLFNSSAPTGTMLSRTTFSPISKQPLDTLFVTWKITII